VSVSDLPRRRPLRADAQRNLGHILDAALEVFAREGSDATVAEIAARAGVGTATIFRRFPTKDDLLLAVLEHRLNSIHELARSALEHVDPRYGFTWLIREATGRYLSDRSLCEANETGRLDEPRLLRLVEEIQACVASVLLRAQQAGVVRCDVVHDDVKALVEGVARAGLPREAATPGAWHRYLDVVLDGLTAPGAAPLSQEPWADRPTTIPVGRATL
jgi:AcrR family transcriptional regulator